MTAVATIVLTISEVMQANGDTTTSHINSYVCRYIHINDHSSEIMLNSHFSIIIYINFQLVECAFLLFFSDGTHGLSVSLP